MLLVAREVVRVGRHLLELSKLVVSHSASVDLVVADPLDRHGDSLDCHSRCVLLELLGHLHASRRDLIQLQNQWRLRGVDLHPLRI